MNRSTVSLVVALALGLTLAPREGTVCAAADASADPGVSLVGLWSAERVFGPEVAGRLVVSEQAGRLTADIAGFEARVTRTGSGVSFELPGNRGAFRGRFQGEPRQLVGHWIQPPTMTLHHASASPVRFRAGADQWVGEVVPVVDRLRLYLSIRREDDGTLRAFLRNPERNLGIQHPIHKVDLTGPVVRLLRESGELDIEGRYHRADGIEALALYLPFPGVSFDFRRTDPSAATAFYPAPDRERYLYRAPRAAEDGWDVAGAGELGLRVEPLQDLVRHVRDTVPDSVRTPYIHSILVAHKGKLVLEEYFYGHHAGEVHDTRSAGKSLASMLVGAALDGDRSLHTDRTLRALFGDRAGEPRGTDDAAGHEQRSAWREQMTLGHLLSMRSGLACDDNEPDSPGNEDRMQDQDVQPDWVQYALDLPMARAPGQQAVYCSNGINLAAAALAQAQGLWLPEFFADRIAAPLNIDRYYFNLAPDGQGYMGGGIRLTPRDQLKLAQVMLDDGLWRGGRVLSNEWVQDSLAAHAGIHEAGDYGYGWWRRELDSSGAAVAVFYAAGNGGQFFIGIPELDLAVQFSGGNYGNFPVWNRFLTELVPAYILPAVAR